MKETVNNFPNEKNLGRKVEIHHLYCSNRVKIGF